jgi:hypothetical protein
MGAPKKNKNAVGNEGGRPPLYNTTEELENKCNLFFEKCKELKEPPTISGLAYYLGFADRQSLYDYENKVEFTCIIKRNRLRVESEYEKALRTDRSATGAIFALKNMGWHDKQEVDHSGEIKTSPLTPEAAKAIDTNLKESI